MKWCTLLLIPLAGLEKRLGNQSVLDSRSQPASNSAPVHRALAQSAAARSNGMELS